MKTVFMGGKQAGVIGLLTLCATGHRPSAVVAYGEHVFEVARSLGIPFHLSTANDWHEARELAVFRQFPSLPCLCYVFLFLIFNSIIKCPL